MVAFFLLGVKGMYGKYGKSASAIRDSFPANKRPGIHSRKQNSSGNSNQLEG